ncbi:hypothetical protein TOPH_05954 [Tolypocladium ophioglossoides CBS 100239]|uniref:Uncharacterized protein n=1 Tax=Tolypocladium ophioglossoides (strain CBS 100239) TaxID=1163406 RepID=A0A0L0N5A5_TOLOC|nr:hypothetical protein TOPH_05954 [Tolypocladium ophioglossoides CBS 100239]
MSRDKISEEAVYYALKGIFRGANANVRKPDIIRALIIQHANEKDLAALIQSHSVEVVCASARTLLLDEIFGSKKRAKRRFAEIPNSKPAPGPSLLSPAALAKSEAGLINYAIDDGQESAKSMPAESEPVVPANGQESAKNKPAESEPIVPANGQESAKSKTAESEPVVPADGPKPSKLPTAMTSLPYGAQYRLLVEIQHVLEQACFEFAQRNHSSILIQNGWDSPQAAELNLFVRELGNRRHKPATTKATVKMPIGSLVSSIEDIRHAAVHRHRLSISGVDRIFEDSENLLAFLGDDERIRRMKCLRRDTCRSLAELDRNEREASSALELKRKKIEEQRQELKRQEDAAMLDAEEARRRFRDLAGAKMQRVITSWAAEEASNNSRGETDGIRRRSLIIIVSALQIILGTFLKPLVLSIMAVSLYISKYVF